MPQPPALLVRFPLQLQFELLGAAFAFVFDAQERFSWNADTFSPDLNHCCFAGFKRIGHSTQGPHKRLCGHTPFLVSIGLAACFAFRGRHIDRQAIASDAANERKTLSQSHDGIKRDTAP